MEMMEGKRGTGTGFKEKVMLRIKGARPEVEEIKEAVREIRACSIRIVKEPKKMTQEEQEKEEGEWKTVRENIRKFYQAEEEWEQKGEKGKVKLLYKERKWVQKGKESTNIINSKCWLVEVVTVRNHRR